MDIERRMGEKDSDNGDERLPALRHLRQRSHHNCRNKTIKAIGTHENLLTTVKKRKLKWYGHVTRSLGLAKTILQGTVQGQRKRGRQKRRWEDNITGWTGKPLSDNLRRTEDREVA